jgi:hypothetical protein
VDWVSSKSGGMAVAFFESECLMLIKRGCNLGVITSIAAQGLSFANW